ncbi:hypothetical protein GCM10027456_59530 [Kineosporia babensis]
MQAENRQTGWSLMVPTTWSRIRLARDRQEQVAALIGRAFATVSRDQGAGLRREMERELLTLADQAHDRGAVEFYLLSDVMRGLPLAASCVVTVLPESLPANVDPEILARVLVQGPEAEPRTVSIDGQDVPALKVSQVQYFPAEKPGEPQPRATVSGLDVYAPFPDRSQILLLSFRTPVDVVADPMLFLFEAIAGSLRWREEVRDGVR